MAQEARRRLLNTSEDVSQEERDNIMNNFSTKCINSGYSRTQARGFILDGIKGYERLLAAQEAGVGLVHRSREVTQQDRELSKMLEKTDWYKKVRHNTSTGRR